jgi:methylated-DNA-[protein]-cysteine S-methyltransferase
MTFFYNEFVTPFGLFLAATNEQGEVIATAFGDLAALKRRTRTARFERAPERLTEVAADLESYLKNPAHRWTVAIAAEGSVYQKRVWSALRDVPPGETQSYGRLAAQLGSSARAVGRANATNPVCLITPCHRVIGADGSLTGYAFGPERKQRLLEFEGAWPARSR